MQRLLVSVRGPKEAIAAAKGGAYIIDVEFPGSALGTPYPLNILAVRNRLDRSGFKRHRVSTNIGEIQHSSSGSCQAALGVSIAGADFIKFGLAGLSIESGCYLAGNLARSVRKWFPNRKVYPAVFPEEEFSSALDPLRHGTRLVRESGCDGLLIDTFRKDIGRGLLDYYSLAQLRRLARNLHAIGREFWVAGSLTKEELSSIWRVGVDVICVRGAACEQTTGTGRFGQVSTPTVESLVSTVPTRRQD